jgi:peptide/nickel transport system permease protein
MLQYIVRRFLSTIPTMIIILVVGFFLIELPTGDYLTYYIAELNRAGRLDAKEEAEILKQRYALDKPIYERFANWVMHFVQGDFGDSFAHRKPVKELIAGRLLLTMVLSLSSLIMTWVLGIAIGVYCATRQYSLGDNVFSAIAFVGLGVPNFLLALFFLVVSLQLFGTVPVGLFSPEYQSAPFSFAKVADLLKHIWVPAAIVAISGTAGLIRVTRGNLLDVLRANYVQVARAKGLQERQVIWKYALRTALHPLVMSLGMSLPSVISGSEITGIVLNLPTTGPMYLQALRQQDVYLAGTMLVLISIALVIGNFLADLLLLWVDPRIRYD